MPPTPPETGEITGGVVMAEKVNYRLIQSSQRTFGK